MVTSHSDNALDFMWEKSVEGIPLMLFRWNAPGLLGDLAQLLLDKECEILDLPVSADWTGRPERLTSSHYAHYNLLTLSDDCVHSLRSVMARAIVQAFARLESERKPLYVQCWSNVIRAGEAMPEHAHPYPIHGHLSIQTEGSVTRYGKHETMDVANVPGDLTVFCKPGLPHSVPTYRQGKARISIAFDLLPVSWVEADPRWAKRFAERSFIPFELDYSAESA